MESIIALVLTAVFAGIGWLIKTIHADRKERRLKEEQDENSRKQSEKTLEKIDEGLKNVIQKLSVHDDVMLTILKANIERVHEKYTDSKRIPYRVLEATEKEFAIYRDVLHGNGFVPSLMQDIRECDIY
jgi:hypothetical protein